MPLLPTLCVREKGDCQHRERVEIWLCRSKGKMCDTDNFVDLIM